MKFSRFTWRIIGLIVLLGFTAFFFVPVIWVLLATTKTDAQLTSAGPFSFGTFGHFAAAWRALFGFQMTPCWAGWRTLRSTPLGASPWRSSRRSRRVWPGPHPVHRSSDALVITLVTMLMPATALVLPLFLEMNVVNLTDTAWSVILPFSFFPFGVYLCYIFFSSTIPKDLLAAARVDGCNEWGVFRYIALPFARPVVPSLRSSPSSPTGTTTTCPSSCCPTTTSCRSKSAWST